MREIITSDVFKLARIMKDGNVKSSVAELFAGPTSKNAQELGFEIIYTIIEACASEKQEQKVYDLIGGIVEKDADVIKNQNYKITIEDIKAIANNNDLLDFFKEADQLTT